MNLFSCAEHFAEFFRNTHNMNDKLKCMVPDCCEFLAKKHFRDNTREDLEYDREIQARERVLQVFNKQRADFTSDEEYDDYLCMIEDKIDIIVQNKDSQNPEKKKRYKKIEEELKQEEKNQQKNIEERKHKKTQMFKQMKLIEKYIQSNQFQRMNYRWENDNFDLHAHDHNLSDEVMTKFLKDFNLDDMSELQSYQIHELLDKTKYQEKEKMKK